MSDTKIIVNGTPVAPSKKVKLSDSGLRIADVVPAKTAQDVVQEREGTWGKSK